MNEAQHFKRIVIMRALRRQIREGQRPDVAREELARIQSEITGVE